MLYNLTKNRYYEIPEPNSVSSGNIHSVQQNSVSV